MGATTLDKMVEYNVVKITRTQDVEATYSVLLTHMDVHVLQDTQEPIVIQVRYVEKFMMSGLHDVYPSYTYYTWKESFRYRSNVK